MNLSSVQQRNLVLAPAVCAVESTNMANKKKVRFRVMETHFLNMKLNILLHKAQSGATIIAVVALSEANEERIMSSMLLVFPTPVGNWTIALWSRFERVTDGYQLIGNIPKPYTKSYTDGKQEIVLEWARSTELRWKNKKAPSSWWCLKKRLEKFTKLLYNQFCGNTNRHPQATDCLRNIQLPCAIRVK